MLITASIALVFFAMPSATDAFEPVDCLDCVNPPQTQPGCNGLQADRSGGGVSRWSITMNGVDSNYSFEYSLTSPGTWSVNYHFDLYDNRGVKTGTIDLPGAQIYVPPGSIWIATANGSLSDAPFGGTVQMNSTAISDIGGYFDGWGQTDNLGCSIVF